LIETTTQTLLENLALGVVLIVFLQSLFLGDLRSPLIIGSTIPLRFFPGRHSRAPSSQSAADWRDRFWLDRLSEAF
jgi:hypothetical protein